MLFRRPPAPRQPRLEPVAPPTPLPFQVWTDKGFQYVDGEYVDEYNEEKKRTTKIFKPVTHNS